MRFIFNMIIEEAEVAKLTPEQMDEALAQMGEYNDKLKEAGVFVSADGLSPTAAARTLRFGVDGKVVATDGPFAETKEQIGGFWIIECKDLDEAAAWAARAPVRGESIEVRPIADSAQENFEAHQEAQKA